MIHWRLLTLVTLVCLVFTASAVAVCIYAVRARLGQKEPLAAEGKSDADKPAPPQSTAARKPVPPRSPVADARAAERGEKALLGRAFNPANWTLDAYKKAGQRWGDQAKVPPERYAAAFRERYGLHPAPYPNGDYPMGLREAPGLFGKGLVSDCLLCHGGSILGKSYVGLGNSSLDIQALFEDLNGASGLPARTPFPFANVRGTSEAGSMSVYLLSLREPDLRLRGGKIDLDLRENLCEDVPAWWLLKKKPTMYHTGSGDARSVRSLMQFLMGSLNPPAVFEKEEATFRDIQAYLLSLQPPKYPFPINEALAHKGEALFTQHCARCHGTYGDGGTYPNKIVPLDVIGTDPTRHRGISEAFTAYYNKSWFAHEQPGWLADEYPARQTAGYQAPPLDGIWATAPYFHNGSVPTVYQVLNSKSRLKIFTRSYRTDQESYDPVKLGWKVQALDRGADPQWPAIERRKVYDTTQPGRGNGGHTFGDKLTEAERMAVIEYLKTL
jgi:mono/diheme cytochrome c family protein